MPKVTPTELFIAAESYASTHECPYAAELSHIKELRDLGVVSGRLATLIDTMHLDLDLPHRSHSECAPVQRGSRENPMWNA